MTSRFAHPHERLYAFALGAMFVFGVVLGLPGTVLGLSDVAAQFDLTLASRGTLISTLFLGLLAGSFTSGPLVDALGPRTALVWCTALSGLCLPLLASSSTFFAAGTALAALGVVAAGVNTASNALSSDLFPHERGHRMNGLAVMVGLGGLAIPLATALAASVISWRGVLTAAGAGAGLIAALGLRSTRAATVAAAEHPLRALKGFMAQREFGVFCALLLLGGANEASVAGWTSTYLGETGFSPSRATLVLASHWLGLVVGRLVFSRLVDRAKRLAVVRGALGVAAGIGLLASTANPIVLSVTPFAIGLALSIVMPTMLALAGERFRGNPGTLFGLLLTLAQVGGIVVPSLVGAVADRAGVSAGLLVIAASALLVVALTLRLTPGRETAS